MKCGYCKREFDQWNYTQKYCSHDCARAAAKIKDKIRREQQKKKKVKSGMKIAEIDKLARAEGLTYGQYVALHGLQ